MTRRPYGRAVLLAACAGVLLASAPPATAAASDVTVVVTLRPADGGALARAAALPPTASAAARRSALRAARPTTADDVARYLARKGLTVTARSDWSLTVRGSVAAAKTVAHPAVAAVTGLRPSAPWTPRVTYTGAAFRDAYDIAAGDGTGLTVATVQFAGWDPGDLDTYATQFGLPTPDPVEVVVGDADPRDTTDELGSFEVAMDQEAILAAAPNAAQRIYFAPNSDVDAVLLYERLADDAEAGLVDVVSVSWGMCELFASPQMRTGIDTALARIVGAGATVFAASGDLGAYDCGDEVEDPHVDYPAASPYVVGVGGTTLLKSGAGWLESAWNDPERGYATGGGASTSVPRPAWQQGLPPSGTTRLVPDVAAVADPATGFRAYSAGAGGWVSGGGTSLGAPLWAGHLASALSARGRTEGVGAIHPVLYANPGAFRDVTTGSNLLHNAAAGYDRATGLGTPRWTVLADALFGDPVVVAPAATSSRTVPLAVVPPPGVAVTSWTVGEGSTVDCAPGQATAPESYVLADTGDRVTRIAVAAQTTAGCLVGSAPVILDTARPVASGTVKPYRYDARTVFTWGSANPAPGSAVTYDVCVYRLGSGCVWTRTGTLTRSVTLTLSQGRSYVLRVTPRDAAGNTGARLSTARYAVPVDQSALARSGSWVRTASSADWYGSHYGTATPGSSLSKVLAGTRYELIYVAHPAGGLVDVYVSGVRVRTINTYAATKTYRKTSLIASYATRSSRAVKVVARSGYVAVDAVRVAY